MTSRFARTIWIDVASCSNDLADLDSSDSRSEPLDGMRSSVMLQVNSHAGLDLVLTSHQSKILSSHAVEEGSNLFI